MGYVFGIINIIIFIVIIYFIVKERKANAINSNKKILGTVIDDIEKE